jgi:hypothetical protein
MAYTAAIIGGGMALKALADYFGSKSSASAAKYAADQQAALAREQMELAGRASGKGYDLLGRAGMEARGDLMDYTGRARTDLLAGNQAGIDQYTQGINRARADLGAGYDAAAMSLGSGYDAGAARLSPLTSLSRYGEMAVASPLGANFQTDPGYQFRLSQGQDAVNAAASAAGGRLSGAALKKLTEYNQGFASNEFGAAANRDLAMRQMQMGLANVGYGATNTLAGMDVSRGLGLSQLDTSRGAGMAGLSEQLGAYGANLMTNQGTQLSNLNSGLGTQIANLRTNTAGSQSDVLLRGAGMQSGLAQNMLAPTYSANVPYAGGGWNALGNAAGQATNLAAFGAGAGWFGGESPGMDPYYLSGGTDFGY